MARLALPMKDLMSSTSMDSATGSMPAAVVLLARECSALAVSVSRIMLLAQMAKGLFTAGLASVRDASSMRRKPSLVQMGM